MVQFREDRDPAEVWEKAAIMRAHTGHMQAVWVFVFGMVTTGTRSATGTSYTLWTQGSLLHAVQTAPLFNDSKDFVDMPATADPSQIEAA
jgi:hypothetical protein